jgi:surface protein
VIIIIKIIIIMVFTPATKTYLQNALNKWYELANNSSDPNAVDTANNVTKAQYDAGTYPYYGNPNTWDVRGPAGSRITDMSELFKDKTETTHPDITTWDVSQVINMSKMFLGAAAFNGDISQWNVSQVTRMSYMFQDAAAFNQPIGNWNTSKVEYIGRMFNNAVAFDQDINTKEVTAENSPTGVAYTAWDVSKVKSMKQMFSGSNVFNQPIGNWNVSAVNNMESMFQHADAFNQDISNWDTSSVTTMRSMFMNAYSFNQDISNWDVSKVENMSEMFSGSITFQNSFGGATRVYDTDGTTYKLPESAESWGGFAVTSNELNLPLKFTNDGTITFNGYTLTDVNIKFRLEKDLYVASSEDPKQTTDFYETSEITIIPSQTSYSITIPFQGTKEFNNVILYVVTRDVPVTINGLSINNDTPSNKMSFDQNINIWKVNQYKSNTTTPTELTYMFDNTKITNGNPYGFSIPTPTYDEFNQNIGIKGTNPVTIEKGTTYTDAGAVTASDVTNLTTTNQVDTNTAGTYSVIYSGTKGVETVTATRTVNVVDTTAPVITVTGDNPATVEKGTTYTDAGASADGGETVTTTGTVNTSVVGSYTLTYSATDAAGNTGTATRTVNVVDTTAPVITVTGDNPATVEKGTTYTDAGASADGGETVTTTGTVNTSVVGTYTITYSATDAAGNTGTATRTVNVVDTTPPIITANLRSTINNGQTSLGSVSSNEPVTWSTNNPDIQIDGQGNVSLQQPANYKEKTSYSFTITATDPSNNTKTTYGNVSVYEVFTPETKDELITALNKWYEIANDD